VRPVDRGLPPVDSDGPVRVRDYPELKPYLEERLGPFCSYCEMKVAPTDVEHKLPKGLFPELRTEWDNLLLACDYCNSTKGQRPTTLADHYWPDEHNTALAFAYPDDGTVAPGPSLALTQAARAAATIELLGLAKRPDRRHTERLRAWDEARDRREQLRELDALGRDTAPLRASIAASAGRFVGFWSVWRAVFADDADMLQRLNAGFPGTAADCFDAQSKAVAVRRGL